MVKVTFSIPYDTHPGQNVRVVGNAAALGSWDAGKGLHLNFTAPNAWSGTADLAAGDIEYKYVVDTHGNAGYEFGDNRKLTVPRAGEVILREFWRPFGDPQNALYTSFFLNGVLRPASHTDGPVVKDAKGPVVRFNLRDARVETGHRVAVTGSTPELGNWDAKKALVLGNRNHPQWEGEAPAGGTVEYKYLIVDASGKPVVWEEGPNRIADASGKKGDVIVLSDEGFRYKNNWRGAGVAIPVFSLRSHNGFGVGEFPDIKLMVDWAKRVGLKLVQILPINDTVATHRWKDSYPYAGISVFALHPLYLNVHAIGRLSAKLTQDIIDVKGKELNTNTKVDYEASHKLKSRFYKHAYDEFKADFLRDPEFHAFYKANEEWLLPYAVFSYMRDLFQTPDFSKWGKYSHMTMDQLREIADPKHAQHDDIAVHYFIQFHLDKQLRDAATYAKSQGVVLKGDIPIGIYRYSVDAWMYPDLFNMNMQAGAPPDAFATDGQNWGFPTYNWDEMAKDGFQWWRKRLLKMADYFDAFRIDHVLGFFRIWEIPLTGVTGLMGHFYPALPIWRDEITGRGINFDYDRFTKPYIREHFLGEVFGDLADYAKENFLDHKGNGVYTLKPFVDTQRKAADLLAPTEEMGMEERARNDKLKRGLFALHAEVLLFDLVGDGTQFHPRALLEKTHSYRELDGQSQAGMTDLYIDYFYRRQEEFWREKAMVKLPAVRNATNMLICAEDLGMVPACVPGVMDELSMLRLAIQRMPPDPERDFWHPSDTPYLCVASPSCHDMSTVRGWWEEDREVTAKFWHNILGHNDPMPYFCEPWVVKEVVAQHMWSPSMLAIFPVQDLIGIDGKLRLEDPRAEQINVPANPEHYWRYRMHIALEDLLKEDKFNDEVLELVRSTGRLHAY